MAVEMQKIPLARGEENGAEREIIAAFAPELDSPGRARRLVTARLRQWGHEPAFMDEAALVISELTTNAVLHAESSFSIVVRARDSRLYIAVQDKRPLTTLAREQGLTVQPGHGLSIVDTLCTCWGVKEGVDEDGGGEGKVVWAELPYDRASV